jgi:hypothetical protein
LHHAYRISRLAVATQEQKVVAKEGLEMTNRSDRSGTNQWVVEDWFEEQGGIDWIPSVEEASETEARAQPDHELEPTSRVGPETAAPRQEEGRQPARNGVFDIVRQHRAIFLLAVLGLVAVVGLVAAVTLEQGGGAREPATKSSGTSASASKQARASHAATSAAPPAPATNPRPSQAPPAPAPTTEASSTPTPSPTPPAARQTPKPSPSLIVELPAAGRLQRGDTGEEVVKLQKALLALELDPGSPDGTFGDQTQSAVISFQSANGLEPDGVVGDETTRKLNTALKARRSA